MLDIGWQELLVIGVLALLVVGPKELPGLLRTVGQWAGKARSVAREFQRSMEDAAREADVAEFQKLKDVKRDVESMTRLDYSEQAKRAQSYMTGGGSSSAASAGEGKTTGNGSGATGTDAGSASNGAAEPAQSETPAATQSKTEAAPAETGGPASKA